MMIDIFGRPCLTVHVWIDASLVIRRFGMLMPE